LLRNPPTPDPLPRPCTSHLSATPPLILFFSHAPPPTEIYTLSLHDALPICAWPGSSSSSSSTFFGTSTGSSTSAMSALAASRWRSEEHTSELQSRFDLVCRLLLEKKKREGNIHRRGNHTRKTESHDERTHMH